MTTERKQSIARILFAASLVLFLAGLNVLCYCPGWFALAAIFAIVARIFCAPRLRIWTVLLGAASLVMMVEHFVGERREREQVKQIQERMKAQQEQK